MNESGYRFDSFVVDFSAREFVRDGERIHLQEQPFRLLMMLLERPNQVVTREELRKKLWPANVLIDFDHRLNNAIARLREVLGDDADSPRFIETVPRVGYRFIYLRVALRRVMDSECPLCGGHFKPSKDSFWPISAR